MRKNSYKDKNREREIIRKQKQRYYSKTANAPNGRRAWTKHELKLVMEHSIPDMELSKIIGRSVAAIQKMRCVQKKMDAER